SVDLADLSSSRWRPRAWREYEENSANAASVGEPDELAVQTRQFDLRGQIANLQRCRRQARRHALLRLGVSMLQGLDLRVQRRDSLLIRGGQLVAALHVELRQPSGIRVGSSRSFDQIAGAIDRWQIGSDCP